MKLSFVFVRPNWTKPAIKAEFAAGLGAGLQIMHGQRTKVKFTEAGGRSYRFKQRNRGYRKKKARVKGHNKPNVWSGAGRRQILRPMKIRPFKSQATATGTMTARFLNLSNARGWHIKTNLLTKRKVRNFRRNPDHRGEMEKLLKTDEKIIAQVAERHTARFFDSKGRTKTVRI